MNWIKIATTIGDDPRIGRIADACRCSANEALGAVVRILVKLPHHAPDGDVGAIPGTILEQWAVWRGKAGQFGTAFRAEMCDDTGRVRSWEKWNGAAMREAERTRERAKEWRDAQKSTPDERGTYGVREPYGTGTVHVKKEKEKEKENTTLTSQAVVDIPSPPTEVLPWVHPVGHEATAELFAAVAHVPTWVGLFRGFASGTSMDNHRPCDPARLAAAVQDFVGAGKHRESGGPSPQLFRGFVKRAKAPVPKHHHQLTEAEHKAEQLRGLREQNARRRKIREPERPEPTWATAIDAMFPDGRTHPSGLADAA